MVSELIKILKYYNNYFNYILICTQILYSTFELFV